MRSILLKFPPTGGGTEDGVSHSGIETFSGDFGRYLAREVAQNAIDASFKESHVTVSFDLLDIESSKIPALASIKDAISSCSKYFEDDKKAATFCMKATEVLSNSCIPVLKISDRGTTGLEGDDTDRKGKWYGLIRSAGVSNKADGAGGSFGIGKYAPFAGSHLRTVLYSTRLAESNEVAFQGVSILWSHRDSYDQIVQGTGYIGYYDQTHFQFEAVRNSQEIPSGFSMDRPGTDVYILGYRGSEDQDWTNDLVFSLVSNFWPAILRDLVSFKVREVEINLSSLNELIRQAEIEQNDKDDFTCYYHAYTSDDSCVFEQEFPLLGKVSLYLLTNGNLLPKRIAFSRKSGMIIETRAFRTRTPYAGFLECLDENGNEFFRSMEPPRHDQLDRERLPSRSNERKVFDSLIKWVRDKVYSLEPKATEEAMDVPELAKYLPDETEDDAITNTEATEQDADEGFDVHPSAGNIEVVRHNPILPTTTIQPEAGSGTEGEGLDGEEGDKPDPHGVSKVKGGIKGKGRGDKNPGLKHESSIPEPSIRSIHVGGSEYILIVRSKVPHAGLMRIYAIGEDGSKDPVTILKASCDNMEMNCQNTSITGVTLAPDSPAKFRVELKSSSRLALFCELSNENY